MRLKLITCEVFYREMCAALARSPNEIDIEFLPKGLHRLSPGGMLAKIQEVLDRVDESVYDAVILGYGVCNGLRGLTARTVPIVLPRAHDCIGILLGSRQRHADYFRDHPGTYFKTSGWIERRDGMEDLSQLAGGQSAGLDEHHRELARKYGEDNARFLIEEIQKSMRLYRQLVFIEMGVEPDERFERQTAAEAETRGLNYQKLEGDMSLIERLVDGDWDEEDFLVVQPGQRIVSTFDERIIGAE